MDTPRSAAPLPDNDELALLQIIDERLTALAAEENALKALRSRLLTRIEPEGQKMFEQHDLVRDTEGRRRAA